MRSTSGHFLHTAQGTATQSDDGAPEGAPRPCRTTGRPAAGQAVRVDTEGGQASVLFRPGLRSGRRRTSSDSAPPAGISGACSGVDG
ncbi:hypothetical protein San01_05520 [Streptomyces angustmyceticus]|uniref:Uncharacterized protein n=1 Tax=Streptomyces angustmyceticus TaxID=285578 RepID=A0A5J4LD78_9ACTN|nr:hypothetical protein San01_05520 [Streptomyces angustmyceticus]